MGFDNTVDNRWRPDLEASRRRVREEEAEERVLLTREPSFVPARRSERDDHDAQTRALIAQHARLERLPHGSTLSERLETWRWMDAMKGPEDKQAYISPPRRAIHPLRQAQAGRAQADDLQTGPSRVQ